MAFPVLSAVLRRNTTQGETRALTVGYTFASTEEISASPRWDVGSVHSPHDRGRGVDARMTQTESQTATAFAKPDLYLIFDRCYDDVHGFFSRRGFGADEVGDLIQETFVEVVRSWPTYRGDAPIEGWVLGIASNVFKGTLRYRARTKRNAEVLSLEEFVQGKSIRRITDDSKDPLGRSLAAERASFLRRAMNRLPAEQRHCLVLRIYQDLSYREISELLLISTEAAKSRVFQARRRLRDELSDHFEIDLP